jgi:ATP-dependent RNA helicase DDX23/PRP28
MKSSYGLFSFRARLKSDQAKDDRRRYDERHWSDKNLEEMADRDWRIFKEDFNITTRGGNIPHPIRFWEEAGLEKGILEVIKLAGYTVSQTFYKKCFH